MKNYGLKICQECNKEYIACQSNQKYCGSQKVKGSCAYIVAKRNTREYQQKHTQKLSAICPRCTREFTPYTRNQVYCGSRNQKYSCNYEETLKRRAAYIKNKFPVKDISKELWRCLDCNNEYKPKAWNQKYCGNRRDRSGCSSKRCYQAKLSSNPNYNKEKVRDQRLKYSFGISLEDYNLLLEKQNGTCFLCPRTKSASKTALAVDHDHSNGKIRGILCDKCNRGLGLFEENPERLIAAAKYINDNRTTP